MRHPLHHRPSPLGDAMALHAADAAAIATRMQDAIPAGTTRLLAMLAAARLLAHCIDQAAETEDEPAWVRWVGAVLLLTTRLARQSREARANAVRH